MTTFLRQNDKTDFNGLGCAWANSVLNSQALPQRPFEMTRLRWQFRRPPKTNWIAWILTSGALIWALVYEIRTSAFQSRLLAFYAQKMTYTLGSGSSPNVVFPKEGPFNLRHGYAQIPDFQRRLESKGFSVTEQARFSPWLAKIARWGIAPPYREPATAGLVIKASEGLSLYDTAAAQQLFSSYEEIPPLIIQALLHIENRELGEKPADPRSNPVLEWDRLAKAGISYAGGKLGLPLRLEGGSTLATQLEKYRHSPQGRTHSVADKMRQITGASLKAYRSGTDTRAVRREIVLDYLNTMPLAAAPGYGEVHGLGEGLHAWFGVSLDEVCGALQSPATTPAKVRAFKQALTLLASTRAPSSYLIQNRSALETRALHYAGFLEESGLMDPEFARELENSSLTFLPRPTVSQPEFSPRQKASNALRISLMELLGVPGFYDLDRLDLEVKSTLDAALLDETQKIFEKLRDAEFLDANGFRQDRLLSQGDPGKVIYSLMLFETTPQGNALRVQTDSLQEPLDINEGMKMELGSTAKLRTLVHYLELVASLFDDKEIRNPSAKTPQDPITSWVAGSLQQNPQLGLDELLQQALGRTYSASPEEGFFTGGGLHTFANFDSKENGRRMTVRESTYRSTNLVFIRLMRDLVRFHRARLPYEAEAVLADPASPVRRRLLDKAAEEESKQILFRAYKNHRNLPPDAIVERLLGKKAKNNRHLAVLFFTWYPGPHPDLEGALTRWFESRGVEIASKEVQRLIRAYGNPRLNLKDYGYLIRRHPLELWCAGELILDPAASWSDIWAHSPQARRVASSWLYQARHHRAQDIRLRIQIEQDAFARMTAYWQRLGFPFERLVPSYATAIGNSSDRPAALAKLMGIIVNDGELRPTIRLEELRFALSRPYHTVMQPSPGSSARVIAAPVARAVKDVLAGVVREGTARRLARAFAGPDGTPIAAGGKTGSGDNRFKSFSRSGGLASARAVNRTATFVFYIGDRYFGVVSASVLGKDADPYRFTSALPVMVLKLLAPALNARSPSQQLSGALPRLNGEARIRGTNRVAVLREFPAS